MPMPSVKRAVKKALGNVVHEYKVLTGNAKMGGQKISAKDYFDHAVNQEGVKGGAKVVGAYARSFTPVALIFHPVKAVADAVNAYQTEAKAERSQQVDMLSQRLMAWYAFSNYGATLIAKYMLHNENYTGKLPMMDYPALNRLYQSGWKIS